MRIILALLLFTTLWFVGCSDPKDPPYAESIGQAATGSPTAEERSAASAEDSVEPLPEPIGQQVILVVQGSDGRRVQVIDDVVSGTTLETVMRQADELGVVLTGSGTTAFVHQIGDLETGRREGWTYKVDGEFADVGVGQFQLEPPTLVQWSYGTMDQD